MCDQCSTPKPTSSTRSRGRSGTRRSSSTCRLEYRPHGFERVYVDIWGHTAHGPLALELKYVTLRCSVELAGERFDLSNHGAHDLRRYDFIKDLVRLERVVEAVPTSTAAAMFLTNDPEY